MTDDMAAGGDGWGDGEIEPVPLTAAQNALWFAQQSLGDIPLTIAQYIDVSGRFDIEAVRAAVATVGRTLGPTITRMAHGAGGPAFIFDESGPCAEFDVVDLRTRQDPVADARTMMEARCRAPMSLDSDRLLETCVLRVGDDRWFLFSRAHHILLDGFGAYVLLMGVAEEYRSIVSTPSGSTHGDPDGRTARDFHAAVVTHEARYRESARYERDRDHWSAVMDSLPHPVTLARGAAPPSADPIRAVGLIDPELNSVIAGAATRLGHGSTVLIVAALSLYLARATGQPVVAVSLPVATRTTGWLRRGAGSMSNLLPLVVATADSMSLQDLLNTVSSALIGALRHQSYRYERMLREQWAGTTGITHVGPVLNIFPEMPAVDLGAGTEAEYHVLATGPVADLNINIYPSGSGSTRAIDFEANPQRYDRPTVECHRDNLIGVIRSMCAVSGADSLAGIGIPAVSHRDGDAAAPALLAELLARNYGLDSPAVVDGTGVLSHRELAGAVDELAGALRGRGVGPEDMVAVALSRNVDSVVAFHAVAAVGACYVPVDPHYPRPRRERIIADSGAIVVLDGSRARGGEWRIERTSPGNDGESLLDIGELSSSRRSVELERAAYVMFTSGSTGQPKCVVVTDAGFGALAAEIESNYGLCSGSVVAHISSIGFDTSVVEMLAAAVAGATLVIVPDGVVGGPELAEYLCDEHVTHLMLTPGVLASLLRTDIPTVTHIIVGGDVCPPDLIRKFAAHTVLRCAYGPTETTCSVTLTSPVDADAVRSLPLPIGSAMSGVRLQVRDWRLRPVPDGVVGDLYISGFSIARGYLGDTALTAANFVADPTSRIGDRMYRTGDRVAWRGDGSLDFVGRADRQVKIRGVRVEPAEVDAVLLSVPGVRGAITVAVRHHRSHQLASYVVASGEKVSAKALRTKLAAELPAYMVPPYLALLDAFPLTSSGKIDRTALPPPSHVVTAPFRAAESSGERLVAHAFVRATGAPSVGADDDFFELGGDSLAATEVVSVLNRSGVTSTITVRDVFDHRTPASLARRLADGDAELAIVHRRESRGPHRLAPVQRNIDVSGLVAGSLIPFTVRIGTELDTAALARAVKTVVARHVALRCRLVGGRTVVDGADAVCPVVSWLGAAETEIEDFLSKPVDLASEHPIRFGVRVSGGATTIAVCAHHLYVDGWSLGIIARDLMIAYAQVTGGETREGPECPSPALDYLDYASWARRRLGDPVEPSSLHHQQMQFWRSELVSVAKPFATPSDRLRPEVWDHQGARARFSIESLWPVIRSIATAHVVSTTTVLRASLARVLCRRANAETIAIGSLVSGRVDGHFDDVVGMFVNTVPVVCGAGDGDVGPHLADICAAELRAMSHADIPMADLAEELWVDGSAHPFFQTMLTIENGTPSANVIDTARQNGVTITPRPPAVAKCDLHVAVTTGSEGFVEVLYPLSMWDDISIADLVEAWFADLRGYPRALG